MLVLLGVPEPVVLDLPDAGPGVVRAVLEVEAGVQVGLEAGVMDAMEAGVTVRGNSHALYVTFNL